MAWGGAVADGGLVICPSGEQLSNANQNLHKAHLQRVHETSYSKAHNPNSFTVSCILHSHVSFVVLPSIPSLSYAETYISTMHV